MFVKKPQLGWCCKASLRRQYWARAKQVRSVQATQHQCIPSGWYTADLIFELCRPQAKITNLMSAVTTNENKKQPSSRLNGIWSATQALNNMCKFQLRLRPQENGVKSHAKLWPLFTLQLLLAGAPRKSYDFFRHPQQRSKPQIPAFISIGCLCLSIVTKHHFELPFCLALSLLPPTVPWCIFKTTKEQARWPHKAHQRVEQFVAFVSRFWLDWSGLGSISEYTGGGWYLNSWM